MPPQIENLEHPPRANANPPAQGGKKAASPAPGTAEKIKPEKHPRLYIIQLGYPLDSMQTGAQGFYTLHQLVGRGFGELFKSMGAEQSRWGKVVEVTLRGTEVVLNVPPAIYETGLNHEIFGHGTRDREVGCSPDHDLNIFNGKWGQSNGDDDCSDKLSPTDTELALTAAGGLEASSRLAETAGKDVFDQRTDVAGAVLYIAAKSDMPLYIFVVNRPDGSYTFGLRDDFGGFDSPEPGGDIARYWEAMSYKNLDELIAEHGISEVAENNLWHGPNFSYRTLQAGAIWSSVADPTFLYLGYQTGKYVVTGEDNFELPNGLPRTNFVLTVNGPKFYFTIPLRIPIGADNMIFETTFHTTVNHREDFIGMGFEVRNIRVHDRVALEAAVDFDGNSTDIRNKTMVMGEAGVKIDLTRRLSVGAKGGYKTEGHSLGRRHRAGFEVSGNLGVVF